MKKLYIVTLGFIEYAVSGDDALSLMAIGQRALQVKQKTYGEPYEVVPDASPIVNIARVDNVDDTATAEPEPPVTFP